MSTHCLVKLKTAQKQLTTSAVRSVEPVVECYYCQIFIFFFKLLENYFSC